MSDTESAAISRRIEAIPGPPADLRDALDRLAETCLGFLAAYQAWLVLDARDDPIEARDELSNALLWAGALTASGGFVHGATGR